MTTDRLPQELEAKFRVADLGVAEAFLADPRFTEGFAAGPVRVVATTDVYLDTSDFRCLRLGYGLRVRTGGERRLAALKSLALDANPVDGIVQRTEVECELPPAADLTSLAEWPEALTAVLAAVVGPEARFRPLCVIRQERRKCLIYAKAAAVQTDRAPTATPARTRRRLSPSSASIAWRWRRARRCPRPVWRRRCRGPMVRAGSRSAAGGEPQAFAALVRAVQSALAVQPQPRQQAGAGAEQLHAGRSQWADPAAHRDGRGVPGLVARATPAHVGGGSRRPLQRRPGVRAPDARRHPARPGRRAALRRISSGPRPSGAISRAAPDCTAAGRRPGSGCGDRQAGAFSGQGQGTLHRRLAARAGALARPAGCGPCRLADLARQPPLWGVCGRLCRLLRQTRCRDAQTGGDRQGQRRPAPRCAM